MIPSFLKLKFSLEVSDDKTGEIIYTRSFSTQEIMEEHLREMEYEVNCYYNQKEKENNVNEDNEESYNPF